MSDNESQRVTTSGKTSDKGCYNEWQRKATSDNKWSFWPNLLFANNMALVSAVRHFITPEVTAGSSNRYIQNLCKFIREYFHGLS